MATSAQVQALLTNALGLLNNLTNAIEFNTREMFNNALDQFAIIENTVWFESAGAADIYRHARGNILNLVGYAHGDLLTMVRQNIEGVFTYVNAAWVEHLTLVSKLAAAAENIITDYISDVADAVGDKIWDSQKQIISFLIDGFQYVNTVMAVGLTSFSEGIKDILGVIPERVWDYFWNWLQEDA